MSRVLSFLINDSSTDTLYPKVRVTISENGDGTLSISATQEGAIIGDFQGLFFDLGDKSLVGSLSIDGASTGFEQSKDSVNNLGQGVNMNGLLGSGKGYDAGIKIGTSGIGKDDIQSTEFVLSSSARALTIDDFANVDFGVRLTSVGTLGGGRNASSKLLETTSSAINSRDDSTGMLAENTGAVGNVLTNDDAVINSATTVVSWSGGALGDAVNLTTDDGLNVGSLQLNSNGSWLASVSGPDADQLSAGETFTKTFGYSAQSSEGNGDWSRDSAALTISIVGVNDGPVALDDFYGSIREGELIQGASVAGNDSDVDRLDTHTWALLEGSFVDATGEQAQGSVILNADGTWSYDAGSAYDYLYSGESVNLTFSYTMLDNNGASDTADVSFTIEGVGVKPSLPPVEPPTPGPEANDFPLWRQDISHITLVFEHTGGDIKPKGEPDGYYTVKIDSNPGNNDLDLVIDSLLLQLTELDRYINESTELYGVVIKGGKEVTNYYAYGDYNENGEEADVLPEGVGFYLDGTHAGEQSPNAIDISYGFNGGYII